MTIEVSSGAHDHGNYFRVVMDGENINVPGERGIGLVIVEKGTRKIAMARMFDTELDPMESAKLNTILLDAKPGALMIVGVKGDGSRCLSLDLIQTLTLLGSKHIQDLGYQESWAFVVRKGKPHAAREMKNANQAVVLKINRKPRLHHLIVSSASYQVGNAFSVTINDQPQGISYTHEDQRGLVLVVLDNQGKVIFNQIYDTFTSSLESDQMESAIQWQMAQSKGMVMILGVKDEGTRHITPSLRKLIESLGSKEIAQLGFRDSWCFLCRIGRPSSGKEGRSSSSPVTLSWTPKLFRATHPPHQKYSIYYHPPNPSLSFPLSSSLPSSLQHNPLSSPHGGGEVKSTDDIPTRKLYHSPPPVNLENKNLPLYEQPVQSVHHKDAPTGAAVDIGMSVRNNRARRRDTIS